MKSKVSENPARRKFKNNCYKFGALSAFLSFLVINGNGDGEVAFYLAIFSILMFAWGYRIPLYERTDVYVQGKDRKKVTF